MQNELKIFTDGVIKNGDREFTRLIGGFGENKPIITVKQIAELLEKQIKHINERINENIKHFEDGVHIIDLKVVDQTDHNLEMLKSLGYTNMAISKAKNIYILSEAGFLLYLKFAEGDKAVELYKNFIEDYFKTKAENIVMKRTLEEEIEFIKGEKAMLIGTMIMEQDEQKRIEYTMQLERLNNRLSELKSSLDNKTIKKALDSQSKLKESKKEYVNQTDFGARFNNKIGSKTVGKLLKIVGLAKKSYRKTTPYEQYIPKYAINDIDNEEVRRFDVSYKWAYEPCVEFIDKWLTKHNRYEEFYSITDKTKLTAYINSLYNIYVEKVAQ